MRETLIRVPKAVMIALLAIVFVLAFIVTPYWLLPNSTYVSILLLILTIVGGIGWLAGSGDETQISFHLKQIISFGIVLVVLLVVDYQSLTSSIAWRGDEHFHIENTLALVTRLSAAWLIVALVIAGLILFLAWYKPRWGLCVGFLSICFVIVFALIRKPLIDIPETALLRYPFLNYWLFAFLPKIYSIFSNPYQEYLYRVVPFIATAGIVYFLQNALAVKEIYGRFLWVIAFASVPILSYYATILYLEPLAVLLMLMVCLRIKFLLEADFDRVKQDIGWYALIAIGFVKETAVVFLACFMLVRLVTRWLHKTRKRSTNRTFDPAVQLDPIPFLSFVKGEIWIATGIFLPLLLYLFLRFRYLDTRTFFPNAAVLADSTIYPVIARSFVEQFGALIFLFLGGMGLLVWRKEYASALFFLLLVVAYPLFHAIDDKSYVGYSRFNLFVLPPVLAGSVVFIKKISSQRKIIAALLAAALIVLNLWSSPLLADGTKKSHWGIYFSGITEEYYPYQEAFAWLAGEHRNAKILIAGFNYPYPFHFYFSKNRWSPSYRTLMVNDVTDEAEILASAVEKAELRDSTVILFHVLNEKAALPLRVGDFQQEKTFRNVSHSIVIFYRPPENK